MDGCFGNDSLICDLENAGTWPETSAPSPRSPGSVGDLNANHPFSSASSSSPKRSRRSVKKRVMTVPIADADGSKPKGPGEGAPPSDSWAWRKYGQKPIKGSPYPRGYYRCSSSKGCPARKQVERSRTDPTMLVVTYACEHDHPWPQRKTHQRPATNQTTSTHFSPPDPADSGDKFSDLIAEGPSPIMGGDYYWLSDVGSPSTTSAPESTDDFLVGSIADMAMTLPNECEVLGVGDEEDSLFAGLGELPECSVVFRRGFLDRQMLMSP